MASPFLFCWIRCAGGGGQAYQIAIDLNDMYQLDGRDPYGYAGVVWAVAGKFDRPWFQREIFGTIRYMSGAAARKKFNVLMYIQSICNE